MPLRSEFINLLSHTVIDQPILEIGQSQSQAHEGSAVDHVAVGSEDRECGAVGSQRCELDARDLAEHRSLRSECSPVPA